MSSHHDPLPRRLRRVSVAAAASTVVLGLALLAPAYGWVGRAGEDVAARVPTGGYVLPVDGGVVLATFHGPAVTWGPGHRGVDLEAATGSVIRSPADGVVAFTGRVVDRDVVSVVHGDGRRSSFEPVRSDLVAGTAVRTGDPLGTVDVSTHCGPASCVHWGVREGQTYVDPIDLLVGGGPTVLLPEPGG